MKVRKKLYIAVFLIAIMVFVLWSSGLVGLWTDGIAYLANNTEKYTHKDGHLLEGSYSIEVDLIDLESNFGKEIYNDGDHRIYISWLQRTQNGGYDVGFRSSGKYSLSGATLISGLFHGAISDHSFTTSTTAKMTAGYNGKIYDGQIKGQCGLNYKDGDCFSFVFFLDGEPNEANAEDAGRAKLTITDLFKNIWRHK